MAVAFDLGRLELTGRPVPTIAGVVQALNYPEPALNTAAGQFSLSDSGWLVYASGGILPDEAKSLVWVDQKGLSQPAASYQDSFDCPRLSPNGQCVAYHTLGSRYQIWVYVLVRGTKSLLPHGEKVLWPHWSPDGKWLAFGSWRSGRPDVFLQAADGSSPNERLTTSTWSHVSGPFTPDSTSLAVVESHPTTGLNILLLDLQSRRTRPFVNSEANEGCPEFSPDGRWMAYHSDESGRNEVYVRPFPGPGGKWLISSDGGTEPLWDRNGKQLFFRKDNQVWAAETRTGQGFAAGKPRLLFDRPGYAPGGNLRGWDISLDGQRFLMVKQGERNPQPVTEMILVQNWFEELKRLCPTGRN